MESRKSKGRSRKEKFAYPWAMAPMINMRKPVAVVGVLFPTRLRNTAHYRQQMFFAAHAPFR